MCAPKNRPRLIESRRRPEKSKNRHRNRLAELYNRIIIGTFNAIIIDCARPLWRISSHFFCFAASRYRNAVLSHLIYSAGGMLFDTHTALGLVSVFENIIPVLSGFDRFVVWLDRSTKVHYFWARTDKISWRKGEWRRTAGEEATVRPVLWISKLVCLPFNTFRSNCECNLWQEVWSAQTFCAADLSTHKYDLVYLVWHSHVVAFFKRKIYLRRLQSNAHAIVFDRREPFGGCTEIMICIVIAFMVMLDGLSPTIFKYNSQISEATANRMPSGCQQMTQMCAWYRLYKKIHTNKLNKLGEKKDGGQNENCHKATSLHTSALNRKVNDADALNCLNEITFGQKKTQHTWIATENRRVFVSGRNNNCGQHEHNCHGKKGTKAQLTCGRCIWAH